MHATSSPTRPPPRGEVGPYRSLHRKLTRLAGLPFADSVIAAAQLSAMTLRVTPHVLDLIDWTDPVSDPVRRQFLTLAEELEPDHPLGRLDALDEQGDSPVAGLVVRHPDRALLMGLDVCPVYCRYCTRSYAVGPATPAVPDKIGLPIDSARWAAALDWVARHESVQEVVVSGGDIWVLSPDALLRLGDAALSIPHVRRVRFGTRGLTASPSRLVRDAAWRGAFATLAKQARVARKRLAVHTHFNVANELDAVATASLAILDDLRITIRNQSVLLRGVNDAAAPLTALSRTLGDLGVSPYYLFIADLVPGIEHLRTSVATGMDLERQLAGVLPGYDVPRVVVDLPRGGGKRPVHTFDAYDRRSGVSVWSAAGVKPGNFYVVDPLRELSPAAAAGWRRSRDLFQHAAEAVLAPSSSTSHENPENTSLPEVDDGPAGTTSELDEA